MCICNYTCQWVKVDTFVYVNMRACNCHCMYMYMHVYVHIYVYEYLCVYFILYINDIANSIEHSAIKTFSNDSKLEHVIKGAYEITRIPSDLSEVTQ